MKNRIEIIVEDYLNGKINGEVFMANCKKIYEESIITDNEYDLDNVIYLPFIHEFAFWPYRGEELRAEVLYFNKIYKGEQSYQYASFYKISNKERVATQLKKLFENMQTVELSNLIKYFRTPIDEPKTLKDIIYNLIYDVLSKINEQNWEESDFNYHNYDEEATHKEIKDMVYRYLAYYLGIKKFYLSIQVCSNGNVIYTIV